MPPSRRKPRKAPILRSPFEIPIPPSVHELYVQYHHNVNIETDCPKALADRELLLKNKTPLEEKRRIIFLLAHVSELKALYCIQKYLKKPDPDLETWAALAWQECQNAVLNKGMINLMDEAAPESNVIMGGLGGDGTRLRYAFIVSTIKGGELTEDNRVTFARAVQYFPAGSTIEDVNFWGHYILCTCLISFDVAVGDYIEHIINECNKVDPFLRFHYFIKNTEAFTKKEIANYLKELSAQGM